MAALPEAPLFETIELPQLAVSDLDPLLNEEIEVWEKRFCWDFRASATLLRRFLQMHSLYGYALRVNRQVVGYAYYVCEARKGLIGDFYIRRDYNSPAAEFHLLGAVVQGLVHTPGIRRVESQLILLRSPLQPPPLGNYLTRHERFFMLVRAEAVERLQPAMLGVRASFVPWADRYHEEAAHLVSAAYRGHVDSDINDQYRTIPGARQFLTNIIRYPGCGQFTPAATVLAIDERTGRVCGACFASMVSANSGHVTQLCVVPGLRGARLGYELLRLSLERLVQLGCTTTSLTVTCSNVSAIQLYESMGFRKQSTFPALVWQGW
ncbi:MAG TPA: GNAT family N-acetyltransferase [Bryobacteraceae bacterium]|jgi:ribosomal protein S18 acetylase RimI-like enzyme|nr:GNAT family N-acetyltransferase [Bryobacteraceae bacterium]